MVLHSLKKKKTIQTILQPTQIPVFRFHLVLDLHLLSNTIKARGLKSTGN